MLLHSAEIKGRQKRGATGQLPCVPCPPFLLCASPLALLWCAGMGDFYGFVFPGYWFVFWVFVFFFVAVAFWRQGSGNPLEHGVLIDEKSLLDKNRKKLWPEDFNFCGWCRDRG